MSEQILQPGEMSGIPHPGWMDPLMAACGDGRYNELVPQRRRPSEKESRKPSSTDPLGTTRPHRDSAVLVLFSGDPTASGPRPPEDAHVLLLHRAPTLSSHSGQVAFPGGAADETDRGPVGTALREAAEETGVSAEGIDVLAVLPTVYIPVSNFSVAPVLGYWRRPMEVGVVDPAETARVMTVPLSQLLDPACRYWLRHNSGWTGPAFDVDDLVVWGFTAGILAALFHSAGWDLDWAHNGVRDLDEVLAGQDWSTRTSQRGAQ